MGGVTGGGNPDLDEIMNGGGNFVARVTAFYKAKQDADEAVKKHAAIVNIAAKQAEVDTARAKIADDIRTAEAQAERLKGDAGQIASQMTADAGVILEKARATADGIIAAADKRAAEIRADAQITQTKTQAAAGIVDARLKELANQQQELKETQAKLDTSIVAAKQSKDKYDKKYATLTAALAAQG